MKVICIIILVSPVGNGIFYQQDNSLRCSFFVKEKEEKFWPFLRTYFEIGMYSFAVSSISSHLIRFHFSLH